MNMMHGFLGALLAGALFAVSAMCGWKCRKAFERHTKPQAPQPDDQERRRLIEEQQAFLCLQNYTVERAYGMTGGDGYDH